VSATGSGRLKGPLPLSIRDRAFDYSRTYIVGILNITPDSFSDGGLFLDQSHASEHALRLEDEGADILDIGGESTRPGSEPVDLEEELKRVVPVIEAIRKSSNIPISVDTYKSEVADRALEAGADIVNDISGLRFDPDMPGVIARHNAAAILMHIQGKPRSMQRNPAYGDLIREISEYLEESITIAEKAGVEKTRIIVDPGIGFGKTFDHNFSILKHLTQFKPLSCPILAGASRKSFLGSGPGADAKDRLPESLSAAIIASANGAHFVRVHDVAVTKRALVIHDKVAAAQ